MSAWDAIVIGGGHNGLVAGAYLARAGARTIVLEARSKTGGAAATDAPWPEAPEINVTRLSYVMSLMPPRILRDLELERHGYKLFPMGPAYQAWPDGRSLTIWDDDASRNHEQIARFSRRDADAMPRWDAWLEGLAAVLGPLLTRTPPKLGSRRPSDLADLLRLAWRYRGLDVRTVGDVTRLMTMSVSDLLDDWFESEEVKASLAINGVIGTWAGPDAPGTAYVMAHHSIGDVGDGHLGRWGFPEGGMGAVADAIHRSAVALGAMVRTGARVERVLVSGGRATGVVLAGGEELHAPVVVTAIHPRITFLEQVDRAELPADFVADIERWRSRSGVVKINLALGELPDFTADPGTEVGEHHTGAIAMALSVGYIEQAFQDAKQGRGATRPFSDGCIPTVFDKTLAPRASTSCPCSPSGSRTSGPRSPTPRSWRPTPTG
jgi:phytoene dehydrogenase-like protein